jgi:catechol 2,3-dioxygenase-like lactoylglutathione lyase family enzyme
MPPRVTGVLETCLYVDDVARSRAFYERLFGFKPMIVEERICALDVAPGQVLILFKRGGTLKPVPVAGSFIPPHDAVGPQHFAFAIAEADLEAWRSHLAAEGVAIESEVAWPLPQKGRSLYFRDPNGLLIELATPGLWKNY